MPVVKRALTSFFLSWILSVIVYADVFDALCCLECEARMLVWQMKVQCFCCACRCNFGSILVVMCGCR